MVDVSTSVSEDTQDVGEDTRVLPYKDQGDYKSTSYWTAPGSSEASDICKVDNLIYINFIHVFLID